MTTVLLTGFEPFTTGQGLALTHNPTADIVERVARRMEGVTAAVLPVSFAATPAALGALFDRHHPRVWLGLGYAPHRATLDIETVAVNVEHAARGDNDGARPFMGEVVAGGPAAYRTRLDVQAAIRAFAVHGVEAAVGFHAGTFMCNQVFYLGCHRCEAGELDMAAFIHVPPMDDYAAFEAGLADLVAATSPGARLSRPGGA
jgi:pyroglutamyl-peptidase